MTNLMVMIHVFLLIAHVSINSRQSSKCIKHIGPNDSYNLFNIYSA